MTPLGCAIRGGFIEVVRFLLYHGVSPTASIGYGNKSRHSSTLQAPMDRPRLILMKQWMTLLANSLDTGFTALHKAALNGYYEAVDAIIKCGGTPDLVDAFGSTALHVAARGQIQEEDVEGEEDGNDEDYVGEEEEGDGEGEGEDEGEGEGEEEQDEAVTESNEEIQEPTADQVDKSEATEDDTKPKVDHARVIEILINAGVPGGALDGKGRTPLQIAIEKKNNIS
ncbi:ankyrin repeat-containing domain protein, partial [Chytridium lagenaria]